MMIYLDDASGRREDEEKVELEFQIWLMSRFPKPVMSRLLELAAIQ